MPLEPTIPHSEITYQIIGAAMRVHQRMGPGYRERHYQQALTTEIHLAGLGIVEECPFELYDRDTFVGRIYLDHLVEEQVVVEVKAFPHLLTNEEIAQVITYLAATDLKVGILLNFGRRRLQFQRILPPRNVADWPDQIRRYTYKPPS